MSYRLEQFLVGLLTTVVIVGGLSVLSLGVMAIDRNATLNACALWDAETDREVKFISDFPWHYDCLIRTESGWISGSHLYQNETPNIQVTN